MPRSGANVAPGRDPGLSPKPLDSRLTGATKHAFSAHRRNEAKELRALRIRNAGSPGCGLVPRLLCREAVVQDQSLSPGIVEAVRGSVLDVSFPEGGLPALTEALEIEGTDGRRLVAEVQSHADPKAVPWHSSSKSSPTLAASPTNGDGRSSTGGTGSAPC